MNQRWLQRRDRYRPDGEVIDPRAYEVTEIDELTAKRFVLEHHYSASYPAARWRFGLHRGGQLVGVAVFSHPCRESILTKTFPIARAREAVELGRFVLLEEVPGNGETWFLARCFDLLRGQVRGVLSTSDPAPRSTIDGEVVFPGHLGLIYQGHNAAYIGRGKARTLRLLPDGRVFSERSIAKVRSLERGWRHCAAQLEAAGAAPLGEPDAGDARVWLAAWLPRVTRPFPHPGNHRYAWSLDRRMVWRPTRLPYPKPTLDLFGRLGAAISQTEGSTAEAY